VEVVYLHWHDIARRHWPRQPLRLLADGLRMAQWYLLGGGLGQVAALSRAAAFTGFYPVLFALLIAGLALLSAGLVWAWLGPLPGLLAGALLLIRGWQLAEQLGVLWLFRTLRFTHELAEERVPELRQRLLDWIAQIDDLERRAPAEQVVLVGHSCGSFVAVMLAAELRRRPQACGVLGHLELLTLGHNIPHLALLPAAERFRADLAALAAAPRLPWRDWSSRDDWLCFADVDVLQAAGVFASSANYPQRRLLPLAQQRGIAPGLRGVWGRFSQQYQLHFDYYRWLPLEAR
jgi:pimeloyl-ACP methyl ester carboxylesterase